MKRSLIAHFGEFSNSIKKFEKATSNSVKTVSNTRYIGITKAKKLMEDVEEDLAIQQQLLGEMKLIQMKLESCLNENQRMKETINCYVDIGTEKRSGFKRSVETRLKDKDIVCVTDNNRIFDELKSLKEQQRLKDEEEDIERIEDVKQLKEKHLNHTLSPQAKKAVKLNYPSLNQFFETDGCSKVP